MERKLGFGTRSTASDGRDLEGGSIEQGEETGVQMTSHKTHKMPLLNVI